MSRQSTGTSPGNSESWTFDAETFLAHYYHIRDGEKRAYWCAACAGGLGVLFVEDERPIREGLDLVQSAGVNKEGPDTSPLRDGGDSPESSEVPAKDGFPW